MIAKFFGEALLWGRLEISETQMLSVQSYFCATVAYSRPFHFTI